ncbi:MAG: universal stress protein [Pseudomonadota bacterium]|nr:universal stress protein [Desulfobacterales bacterium]
MFKTILVPLDGSKQAEAILSHVEQTARIHGSKVIFLKVEEDPFMLEWDEVVDISSCRSEFEQRTKQAGSYLSVLQKEFRAKGIDVHTQVAYGPVIKSISSAAEDVKADLIAMASHILSSRPWAPYGSVAVGLLQRVNCPLLLVRS